MSRTAATNLFASDTQISSSLDGKRSEGESRLARSSALSRADSAAQFRVTADKRATSTTAKDIATLGKNTSSPESHGTRRVDLLASSRSDTSASSAASPVFSHSGNMSYPGRTTSLHALTPLTSSDSSPPGKLPSPRSAKPSYETMHAATPQTAPSSAPAKDGADTITPVHTPPDTRKSIWPGDGNLGVKVLYDPWLDPKLDRKGKHHYKPKYANIKNKSVRAGYTIPIPQRWVVL